MHFIKTVVSIFALSSFAAAHFAEEADAGLSRRALAESAHDEYLAAREEYIEKRELFRRLGGNGTCGKASDGRKHCYKNGVPCGPCASNASNGQYCLCNLRVK
ncbi:unnamed protein product [Clonostachys solani]|uniref:Uncharacterized protein n=1 Tax=Clonostachys solani TaxID=160281 RepID=A0A9N9ZMV2_9HYPO|nr:unnamed protein product [Clonostachys solani]